ncbi:hypothetical protein EVAR_57149_1 [Eumeta japonica]|uniref:Nucleic-acid-binding protein from transposon X-element n=1 Tax=Eumeta variegata TaxID=151549 RepID=A0A4C1YQ53_EUMVA|nr:hypothetical protein EVAR_57149_1 [Eumeta japonica]
MSVLFPPLSLALPFYRSLFIRYPISFAMVTPMRYVVELEREKARRAAELEAAEKRFNKINQENLDRYSMMENKMENSGNSTKKCWGRCASRRRWRDPKVVARPAPRIMNYAEAAAKPSSGRRREDWPPQDLVPDTSSWLPNLRTTPQHVITKLRGVVDARRWVWPWTDEEGQGTKGGVELLSVEDAKKIEERLKIRGADLKVAKPEMRLPTVIIRDVLRVNSDEDIVRSLRTQNRHLSEGLDWDKVRARVCYRRRARNDLECHPVLEVSPELYHRLIKAGFVYVGLQRRPVWDQSPLVQCSRCLGYGHGKRYCKEVSERCAHCGGEHWRNMPGPKGWRAPKCVNCTKAGCEDTAHGAFSSSAGPSKMG